MTLAGERITAREVRRGTTAPRGSRRKVEVMRRRAGLALPLFDHHEAGTTELSGRAGSLRFALLGSIPALSPLGSLAPRQTIQIPPLQSPPLFRYGKRGRRAWRIPS
jgi:hypothetical protein